MDLRRSGNCLGAPSNGPNGRRRYVTVSVAGRHPSSCRRKRQENGYAERRNRRPQREDRGQLKGTLVWTAGVYFRRSRQSNESLLRTELM